MRVRMLDSSLSTNVFTHTFTHKPHVSPQQASLSLGLRGLPVPMAACTQHLPLVLAQDAHMAGRIEQHTCNPETYGTMAAFEVCCFCSDHNPRGAQGP